MNKDNIKFYATLVAIFIVCCVVTCLLFYNASIQNTSTDIGRMWADISVVTCWVLMFPIALIPFIILDKCSGEYADR